MTKTKNNKPMSLGKRIEALRRSRNQNQAAFAESLGANQGTISAWESDDKNRRPSADMLFRIGSLCKDPTDAIWFWGKAGVMPEMILSAAKRISKELAADRILEHREGITVKVPPISREGPPWYVDARIVPDPTAVAYWDSEMAGSKGFGNRRQIVILDTSAKLDGSWGKSMLIESMGPSTDNPGLPRRGIHMGRLGIYFQSRPDSPQICIAQFRNFSFSPPDDLNYLGAYTPSLTKSERRIFAEHPMIDIDSQNEYRAALYKVEERARREFPLPKGIVLLGRVLTWFRPDAEAREVLPE